MVSFLPDTSTRKTSGSVSSLIAGGRTARCGSDRPRPAGRPTESSDVDRSGLWRGWARVAGGIRGSDGCGREQETQKQAIAPARTTSDRPDG